MYQNSLCTRSEKPNLRNLIRRYPINLLSLWFLPLINFSSQAYAQSSPQQVIGSGMQLQQEAKEEIANKIFFKKGVLWSKDVSVNGMNCSAVESEIQKKSAGNLNSSQTSAFFDFTEMFFGLRISNVAPNKQSSVDKLEVRQVTDIKREGFKIVMSLAQPTVPKTIAYEVVPTDETVLFTDFICPDGDANCSNRSVVVSKKKSGPEKLRFCKNDLKGIRPSQPSAQSDIANLLMPATEVQIASDLKIKEISLGAPTSAACKPEMTNFHNNFLKRDVYAIQFCRTVHSAIDATEVFFSADQKKIVRVKREQHLTQSDPDINLIINAAVNFFGTPAHFDEVNWLAVYGNAHSVSYDVRKATIKQNSSGSGLLIKGYSCGDVIGQVTCFPGAKYKVIYDLINIEAYEAEIEIGKNTLKTINTEKATSQKF